MIAEALFGKLVKKEPSASAPYYWAGCRGRSLFGRGNLGFWIEQSQKLRHPLRSRALPPEGKSVLNSFFGTSEGTEIAAGTVGFFSGGGSPKEGIDAAEDAHLAEFLYVVALFRQ